MRVVPFDFRSFSEILEAALGPMLPLLPYLTDIPDPLIKALEEWKKLRGGRARAGIALDAHLSFLPTSSRYTAMKISHC